MEINNSILITELNNSTGIETEQLNYENCTNDYCISDEDYLAMIEEHVFPNSLEWTFVAVYVITFITGIVGNSLVWICVWKNHTLQTVTNTFIVNLAASDLAVIVVCLPPTLIVDVSETWFMGLAMCRITLFLMNVTVSVSVLTLCAIAVERWYHICQPCSKVKRIPAKVTIMMIWLVSGCLATPELVVSRLFNTVPGHITNLLTTCRPGWEYQSQTIYQIFLIVVLYLLPVWLMVFMYLQIATVLWRYDVGVDNGNEGASISPNKRTSDDKHGFRKKTAIMLMVVVACFAICYLPVHLLNILRYAGVLQSVDGKVISIAALVCHWLPYLNSTMNPIIYGSMSAQFRSQFKKTCRCFWYDVNELGVIEMNQYGDNHHPQELIDTHTLAMQITETQLI